MLFCAPPRAKSWRQTLKFHSPVRPDTLNARLLRSLGFPKSPPSKKSQIRQWIFARYLRRYNTSPALITRHNRLAFVVVVLCNLLSTTVALQRSSDIPLSACQAARSNNTASAQRRAGHSGPSAHWSYAATGNSSI